MGRFDGCTPKAKQMLAMMYATMNLNLDELITAGVIDGGANEQWSKWDKDAPMFIIKQSATKLNALAALIEEKFPDAFELEEAAPAPTQMREDE
jgi:hypothetical protein